MRGLPLYLFADRWNDPCFAANIFRGLAEKTVDDKRFCGLGRRYLEDYISAVRPLCRAAANAKETDLQTIIFMNRNTLCIRFFYMNCTISVNTTTIAAEIPKMGGGIAMKATGIVRRIDDLGRVVIPKEIRRTLRIREGDPLQMTLAPWEKFCFAVSNLAKRNGWS